MGDSSSGGGRGIIQGCLIRNDATPTPSSYHSYLTVRYIPLGLIHTSSSRLTLPLVMSTAKAASNGSTYFSSPPNSLSSSSYYFYSSSYPLTSFRGSPLPPLRTPLLLSLFDGVCCSCSLMWGFFFLVRR